MSRLVRVRSPQSPQSIVSGPSAEPLRNWRTKGFSEENIRSASPASTIRPCHSTRDVLADLPRRGDVVRDDDVGAAVDARASPGSVRTAAPCARGPGPSRARRRSRRRAPSRARARSPARLRIPPESCEGASSIASARPTSVRRSVTHLGDLRLADRSVCWRSGKATLSNTDIEPNSAPSWNSTPILRRSASSLGIVSFGTDFAVHDDVAGVGEHQPDQVLDQHALAGARRAEHDGDRVVGDRDVEPVEHRHAAEALVHVDAADRPVARRPGRRSRSRSLEWYW